MKTAIVASALANKPRNGGFAWVPLSYALGLRRLGYDVWLVEQLDPPNPFFDEVTAAFGLRGEQLGEPSSELRAAAADAELLVNVSGHATLDWLVAGPRRLAYIDTDPGYTQIWHREGRLDPSICRHTHHFSVGLKVGRGADLPEDGIAWQPLPPPVLLDQWPAQPAPADGLVFSTVASWRCPLGALSWQGRDYTSKHHEWRRLLSLPRRVPQARFEVALDIHPADEPDRHALELCGWTLRDPGAVAASPQAFRDYVLSAAAEFSPAQGVYSAALTGWFSDRSARYLAAGRPVLVQETGLRGRLAEGEGVVTFTNLEEARHGAERIAADYGTHSAAARHLAETVFDSDRVLGAMLEQVGASR